MIKTILMMTALHLSLAEPIQAQTISDAQMAFNKKDYDTALKLYQPFAEAGDSMAQHRMALMYFNGLGRPKDFQQSLYWFSKAADNGLLTAN